MKAWLFEATVFATLTYLLFAPYLAWPAEYNWSKVRPGPTEKVSTSAGGTNDASWIVGTYAWLDGSNRSGAYRFQNNKFYEFALPGAPEGARSLFLDDIGKSSTIVGTYFVDAPCDVGCGDGTLYAYLYRHGLNDHIIINVPGAFWSFPFAVNDFRQVAMGYFADHDHGEPTTWGAAVYDYATNTHTPVNAFDGAFPGAVTVLTGINNRGDLTGHVDVPLNDPCCPFGSFAFVRVAGEDHILVPPDWAQAVWPEAINDHGAVVGSAWTQDNRIVGFKVDLATGAWELIQHPKRQQGFDNVAIDIDNQGRIVVENRRTNDNYTEVWWLRPLKPKTVARR